MYWLYGYGCLRDVELCGLLRQGVLLHQQGHHVTLKMTFCWFDHGTEPFASQHLTDINGRINSTWSISNWFDIESFDIDMIESIRSRSIYKKTRKDRIYLILIRQSIKIDRINLFVFVKIESIQNNSKCIKSTIISISWKH